MQDLLLGAVGLLLFIVLLSFAVIFLLAYAVSVILFKNRILAENRIGKIRILGDVKPQNEDGTHLLETLRMLFYKVFNFILSKVITDKKLERFYSKLEKAGLLKNRTKEQWLYLRSMVILFFSASAGLFSFITGRNLLASFVLMGISMLYTAFFFNFFLSRKIEIRKRKILKDLPYTLDLITASVEAGLSFDGAMSRVVGNINGELSDEFAKSLKEIRMGLERKTALKNMCERCEIKELSTFITSVIQSDELGVGLGRVLKIEAAQIRENRKHAAREKAMKAPVKMLFPLIFFIFPAIFIIILGPAVIQLIQFFSR